MKAQAARTQSLVKAAIPASRGRSINNENLYFDVEDLAGAGISYAYRNPIKAV